MTLTPERIAEIEAKCSLVGQCSQWPGTLTELCRLARLGMRVEEAPTTRAKVPPPSWVGPTWVEHTPLPAEMAGKRVALVVLEDSE